MSRQIIKILILFLLLPQLCFAQYLNPTGKFTSTSGSEYFVGTELGLPLITVSIVSGVRNPGVYRVPEKTNLAELLSYSGGALQDSDLSKIVVHNTQNKKVDSITRTYNFNNLINDKSTMPHVQNSDVVFIDQQQGLNTTIKWMSLASMAASIITALVVIENSR